MIKLFEEYNNSDFYYQISPDEWIQYWNDVYAKLGIDGWSDYIRLGNRFSKSQGDYLMSQGFKYLSWCVFRKNSVYNEINVYIGLDEWIFVIIDIGYYDKEYYKCDQWEGLLKLIEDKS